MQKMLSWKDPKWKDRMRVTIDYKNMMADSIGKGRGITLNELEKMAARVKRIDKALKKGWREGKIGFFDLPYQGENVSKIKSFARDVRKGHEAFVVLGIGGSALGPIALQTALNPPHYNSLTKRERNGCPRLFVADNIDPAGFEGILRVTDPEKTIFNVISKSGGTAETMSQFIIVREMLKERIGKRYKDHIVATTDPEKGILRKIAAEEGYETFPIPANVGGRFSVFSSVGLLPASVVGIDIEELLAGADYMNELCTTSDLFQNPAYLNAALQYLAGKKGKPMSVMMPYADTLKDIADWYRQLWAESLGKRLSLDGKVVHAGPTPIKALGATDQHSQLQLYIEGPFDKVITLIGVKDLGAEARIPRAYKEIGELGYLGGHSLKELLQAEMLATEMALTMNHRMNCTVTLPEVNAFTVGQLLQMLMIQTAFAGGLYNIDPFDQPGVEQGKQYACGMMGRKGYEKKKAEVDEYLKQAEGLKGYAV
jgi:glucose-6-phosphate isomerase